MSALQAGSAPTVRDASHASRSDFLYFVSRPTLITGSEYRPVHFQTSSVPFATPRYAAACSRVNIPAPFGDGDEQGVDADFCGSLAGASPGARKMR